MIEIVKWPLIFFSILGVFWLIWWVYSDEDTARTSKRFSLLLGVAAMFSIAILHLFSSGTQRSILNFRAQAQEEMKQLKEKSSAS